MRSVTYVITPERGYFDAGETVFREYGVYLRAIHRVQLCDDGSVVMLYGVDGEPDAVRDCMDQAGGKVLDFHLSGDPPDHRLYVHYYPDEMVVDLLRLLRTYATLLDFPLEFVDPARSSLRVRIVGPEDAIRNVVADTREMVDVAVRRLSSYDPSTERLFAALTERQQEVLRTAVEQGYYELPRERTYEDIAAELDCSASAVGRHLRRVEARLVAAAVPERELQAAPTLD